MTLPLDKAKPTPVYLQLKEMLQDRIEQGVYASNQKLPSERDLCEEYHLSRMTVRKALQQLIADGLAYTQVGKGTFVRAGLMTDCQHNGHSRQVSRGRASTRNQALAECRSHLARKLVSFDSTSAEKIVRSIKSTYPLEVVVNDVLLKTVKQIETLQKQKKISLLAQKYSITTVQAHLTAMVNELDDNLHGAKVVLACAPQDYHEMGLLSLAFNLRCLGFRTTYLGTSVTSEGFYQAIEMVAPHLVCFSASTKNSVKPLAELIKTCRTELDRKCQPPAPMLVFQGDVFRHHTALIETVDALYLGNTLEEALDNIQTWLHSRQQ